MTVIAKPAATTADSHSVRRLRPQSKFLTFMSPAALLPRATPVCSTPPPPQQALDNRRSTWLAAHSRETGGRRPRCKAASRQTGDGRPPCGSAHDVGVDVADPAAARSRVPVRGTVLHTAALLCDPSNNLAWQKRATGLPTICRRKPNFPPTRVAPMGRGWPPTRVAGVWEISEFSHGTRRVVCGASGGDGGERPFDRLTMLACSGLNRATKQYIYVPSIHTPCN